MSATQVPVGARGAPAPTHDPATWYLRAHETDRRLYGGAPFMVALLISTGAIGLLAIYTVTSTLNIFKLR